MASKSPQVNELITCPICFEVYREPKFLPNCLHTFCKSCIKCYSVTAVSKSFNFNTFECPVCRACYHDVNDCDKWVENLPNNHLIVSLIDQGKMEKKELYCDSCIRLEKILASSFLVPQVLWYVSNFTIPTDSLWNTRCAISRSENRRINSKLTYSANNTPAEG